jgi:hypothetical protein
MKHLIAAVVAALFACGTLTVAAQTAAPSDTPAAAKSEKKAKKTKKTKSTKRTSKGSKSQQSSDSAAAPK